MATQRPQHEISIRNFTRFAEQAEQDFGPLFQRFGEAAATARESAAQLLATQSDVRGEMVLTASVEQSVLETVATANALLRANLGPTTSAFVEGIGEANDLIAQRRCGQHLHATRCGALPGRAYVPWCAETNKRPRPSICRFCGRDLQVQPNAG